MPWPHLMFTHDMLLFLFTYLWVDDYIQKKTKLCLILSVIGLKKNQK